MNPIRISAPARLHFGFLDLHGGRGRRFGSLGLALDKPQTTLVCRHDKRLSITGPDHQRAQEYAEKIIAAHGYQNPAHIDIETAIAPHTGLGSGTQLALAIGTGLAILNHAPAVVGKTAVQTLQRGMRSGIGLAAFSHGGLILDGGQPTAKQKKRIAPPPIARLAFPENWRIILIFDQSHQGIHGPSEQNTFDDLPPYSAALAADLCRLVVMQILPAVAGADFATFGPAITELQAAVGDHFASAQNGRYSSPLVADALARLARDGVRGYGQSSWGPTGFAFAENEAHAETLVDNLWRQIKSPHKKKKNADGDSLSFMICRARNIGHHVMKLSALDDGRTGDDARTGTEPPFNDRSNDRSFL